MELLLQFLSNTGFYLADYRNFVMLAIGSLFVYLAIAKQYEPLLLLPIGFGVLIGNIPFFKGFGLGIYEPNSVLHYLYFGVTTGIYPSIVFLGSNGYVSGVELETGEKIDADIVMLSVGTTPKPGHLSLFSIRRLNG